MKTFADMLFVVLILSGFGLLGSSRLRSCIRLSAVQGIALGLLVLAETGLPPTLRTVGIAVAVIALKGIAFPRLLARALRDSDTSREVQPLVGYTPSILAGAAAFALSFHLERFIPLPAVHESPLLLPVAASLLAIGIFLIVARRTAVNQVVGFIVMENGIYAFGVAAAAHVPLLVELGVLMDVFVAVFVMGIAIYHMNHEFDHIDASRLDSLKG